MSGGPSRGSAAGRAVLPACAWPSRRVSFRQLTFCVENLLGMPKLLASIYDYKDNPDAEPQALSCAPHHHFASWDARSRLSEGVPREQSPVVPPALPSLPGDPQRPSDGPLRGVLGLGHETTQRVWEETRLDIARDKSRTCLCLVLLGLVVPCFIFNDPP